jgi:hypothetical protein
MSNQQPPWHFGMKYANQTIEWLPTDSKEINEKLMQDPKHVEYFRKQGWLEPGAITYKINQHGFRSDEFVEGTKNLVALGCSYTVGIGLPLKDLWPTLVATELGLVPYTLAWGGIAADTCYRLAEYWIPKLNPTLVVMLAPPPSRVELLTIDSQISAEVFLPSSESCMFSDQDIFLKNWFANEENAQINNRKNHRALKHLCSDLGITCLTYDAHEFMARSRKEVGYARDHMHAGPRGHQLAFEKIMNDYHGR